MRKRGNAYVMYFSDAEKKFVTEMAWRRREPLAKYMRHLIYEEMKKYAPSMKMEAEAEE